MLRARVATSTANSALSAAVLHGLRSGQTAVNANQTIAEAIDELRARTIEHPVVYGYALDDELVTVSHPLTTKGIAAIPEILSQPYYSDDMGYKYGYRPVGLITFAISWELWGSNPMAEHLINVLLYALLCLILLRWLDLLLASYSPWLSLLTVLIFVVHPTHTEVVSSLKNREELLSLLGGVSAGFFMARNGRFPLLDLFFGLLFFGVGMLSKNSVFLFPIIIPSLIFLLQRNPKTKHNMKTITQQFQCGQKQDRPSRKTNALAQVAVAAFLQGRLPYLRIAAAIAVALDRVPACAAGELDAVLEADLAARQAAEAAIAGWT
jgi:hypothetical protein